MIECGIREGVGMRKTLVLIVIFTLFVAFAAYSEDVSIKAFIAGYQNAVNARDKDTLVSMYDNKAQAELSFDYILSSLDMFDQAGSRINVVMDVVSEQTSGNIAIVNVIMSWRCADKDDPFALFLPQAQAVRYTLKRERGKWCIIGEES